MVGTAMAKLKTQKPIISTSEDLISTDELLARLGSLHEELSTLVQGQADLRRLEPYCTDLLDRKLLKHKDKGVRAFVACCLSDILRLYAPDAPYTDVQLTDIVKLFLTQFEQLGDPENGYYIQQKYLITRLLEYRSIVLLTDLPSAPKLLERLFQIFYDDSRNFEPRMFKVIGGILGEVISEFESVPMNVLKLIFNKFLTYNPDDVPRGLGVVSNCGYEISIILCDAYSTRMSRHLTKYYSEILYTITNEEDQRSFEARTNSQRVIFKLHRLVYRLWEHVPDLISSVIGFIYHELFSDSEFLRKEATKLVGELLTVNSDLNFVTTHQDLYSAWLSKIADVCPEVRQQWTEGVPQILTMRDDIFQEVSKGLAKTLIDSDHRVRKSSVMAVKDLDVTTLWKRVTDKSVYNCLLQLTREKNREVRELSIATVAKFYSESQNCDKRITENKELWEIVKTIPSVLFKLCYINDVHINEQVDNVIFENLLPLEVDDRQRVRRLLMVISNFDQKALVSFYAFNKRQLQISKALTKFVEFSENINDNVSSENEEEILSKYHKTIDWLSFGMADQTKATAALEVLKELNDKRIFHLIKTCVSNYVPFVTLRNCIKELISKLQDPALLRKSDSKACSTIIPRDLARQIKILLYRGSPLNYNVSNIPILLDTGGHSGSQEIHLKRKLLDHISTINPSLFKDQIRTLKSMITQSQNSSNLEDTLTLNEALKTLYKICKTMKGQLDFDDTLFTRKLREAITDEGPIAAKYATKLFALSPNAEESLKSIKHDILPLDVDHDKDVPSHILVLSEIFRFSPSVLNEDSTDIVSYLIKEILLANQVVGDKENDPDWIEDDSLNKREYAALSCKIFSLKLLTAKLKSIVSEINDDELAKAFTEKTIKLFFYLIASGGELISEYNKEYYPTPSNFQTKLRCYAGLQILKLARMPHLSDFIKSPDIIKMINLVEDESLPVRKSFLDHLKNGLSGELISIKFLPLIFFTAYEPDEELKSATKTWINYNFSKESFKRDTFFERALPRLIHAISHHPDIEEGLNSNGDSYLNSLTTAIGYLLFYFDSIAAQENFSLLYYLSERVKNYQDRVSVEDDEGITDERGKKRNPSEKLYIIGELAQMILLALKEKKGWQHSAYPGKLNLPDDIFMRYSSVEETQASFNTYLPDSLANTLQINIRSKVGRIAHTSQTRRQRAQKRMLEHEYHNNNAPNLKRKKNKVVRKRVEESEEESQEDESEVHDSTYKPSQKVRKNETKNIARRSGRIKKNVDYKDASESEEDY